MPTINRDQLRRLEVTPAILETLQADGAEVVPVGPFRAMFAGDTGMVWLDQAAPFEPLGSRDEVLSALRDMIHLFGSRGLPPMMEFNDPLWPELPDLMERAGFLETENEPLMVVDAQTFQPRLSPDVEVHFLQANHPHADLAAYRGIFVWVMEVDIWRTTGEVRAEVERCGGRCHALAFLEGIPVGTGFISSSQETAEIARVATLPQARRRGVAASLTSFMVADRLASGDSLVWLTAQNEGALSLYHRLGFQRVGSRRYYKIETEKG